MPIESPHQRRDEALPRLPKNQPNTTSTSTANPLNLAQNTLNYIGLAIFLFFLFYIGIYTTPAHADNLEDLKRKITEAQARLPQAELSTVQGVTAEQPELPEDATDTEKSEDASQEADTTKENSETAQDQTDSTSRPTYTGEEPGWGFDFIGTASAQETDDSASGWNFSHERAEVAQPNDQTVVVSSAPTVSFSSFSEAPASTAEVTTDSENHNHKLLVSANTADSVYHSGNYEFVVNPSINSVNSQIGSQDDFSNLVITPTIETNFQIKSLSLGEAGDDPQFASTFTAGDQTGNINYTLPTADATGVLTSDGAGTLSWATVTAGSTGILSDITAATGANTIANGDYAQQWNWTLSSANQAGITFGETAASTAAGTPALVKVSTRAASTAIPLFISNEGNAASFRVDDVAADTTPFVINAAGNVGIGTASPSQKLTVDGTIGILEGGAAPSFHTIFQGGDQASDITYTLPTVDAAGTLTSDGSGTLSWANGSLVTADSLNFTDFADAMTIDAPTTIGFAGTTTTGLALNANALTSGIANQVASSSTAMTGTLQDITLSGDNAANTGTLLKSTVSGTSSAAVPLMVTNLGTGNSLRVNDQTGDADTTPFVIDASGRVGIGTASPGQKLTLDGTFGILETGAAPQYHTIFQGGDQIADITYTLPNADASGVLTSDGLGSLSWSAAGGLIAADSLDFVDISDTMTLDAPTSLALNGTTTNGLTFNANSLTSGKAFSLASTATAFTGTLQDITLSGDNAANTGTLLKTTVSGTSSATVPLMVTNLGTGNSFRVNDQTGDADATPFVIDASGNVGIGTATPGAALQVIPSAVGTTGLIVKATAGQTANLQEWQNSAGTVTTYAQYDGYLYSNEFRLSADNKLQLTGNDTVLFANAGRKAILNIGGTDVLTASGSSVGIGTTTPSSKLDVTTTALGTTQTATSGLALVNTTAAAAGAQQISPAVRWTGQGWKTNAVAASEAVEFRSYVVPVQGAADPTGYLSFGSAINGGAWSDGQLVLTSGGNVGVGDTTPASLFTVGAGDLFQVDSAGDIVKIKNVTYAWPAANAAGILTNNGSGTLSWTGAENSITADSLDFSSFSDAMTIDAPTTVAFTGTTTAGLTVNANSLTSGKAAAIASSATAFTGTLQDITLSGDNAANTGTLLKTSVTGTSSAAVPLMVTNLGTGSSFRVNDQTGDADTTPFVIDAAGSVGVGTTTPIAKLDVAGVASGNPASSGSTQAAVTFRLGQAANNGVLDSGQDGSGNWWLQSTNKSNFATNYSLLLNPNGGSVGIGTASPELEAHIVGAAGFPASSGSAQTGILRLGQSANNGILDFGQNGASGSWLQSTNRADLSQIYPLLLNPNGGNVGVGTTAPDKAFEVNLGTTNAFRLTYNDSNGSAANYSDFAVNSSGNLTVSPSGGYIGFGTTTPSSKLDITTTALGTTQTATSGLALVNTTAAAAGAQQISPAVRWTGQGWKTNAVAASEAVEFRSYVVPVQGAADPTGYLSFGSAINGGAWSDGQLVLTSAGNVGIGTTTPSAKLHVYGGNQIIQSSAAGSTGDVGNVVYGGSDINNTNYLAFGLDNSGTFLGTAGYAGIITYRNGTGTARPLSLSTAYGRNDLVISTAGSVGIGDVSPASLFTVGSGDLFQVDSAGDIVKIKNVTYAWPAANAAGILTNNGSGTLSWAGAESSITADSLDFSHFSDAMTIDAPTTIAFTGTTTAGLTVNANSLTSGKAAAIASSATAFTGTLQDITLSGDNAANTGTLLKSTVSGTSSAAVPLMVTNLGTGNSFRVNDQTGDADTTPFVIDAGGSVGVGTATPSSKLDVTTNALGTTQTTTSGAALVNTTAAAAGAQQISPALRWSGQGWKTNAVAASEAVDFRSYVVPVQGAADPTGYLSFGSSVNGGAYNDGQLVLTTGGNVGIGDTTPASLFTVGAGDLFQIDSAGDIVKIKNVTYAWPAANAAGILTNNGSGTLSWTGAENSITADSLDFSSFSDAMTIDAPTTVAFTGTTTAGLTVNANSLTSGKALVVASTATAFTGTLQDITLSGDNAANTGTLLKSTVSGTSSAAVPLMVTNLGTGNSFRVNDQTGDADTTPFVIDASGNVGIGTTTPGSNLDIKGANTLDALHLTLTGQTPYLAQFYNSAYSSSNAVFQYFGYDNGEFRMGSASTTGVGLYTNGQYASPQLYLQSGGNVGIGDTSPASLFTVGSGDLFQVNSSGYALHPLGAVGTPSMSFVGDTNTGIWSSGADTLNFSTGGSERVRIDSSGRVGIGATPGSLLQVGTNADASTTTRVSVLGYSDTNPLLQMGDGGTIKFNFSRTSANAWVIATGTGAGGETSWTGNGLAMTLSGNMGGNDLALFSTTTSGNAWTADAGARATYYFNRFMQPTIASNSGSALTITNAATLYIQDAPAAGTNATLTNKFALYSAAGANYFGGNVGIGATTPSSKLDVTTTALGTTQTATSGLALVNTTAAAAGAQQISPAVRWTGQGWKTNAVAASEAVEFRSYVVPVQGAADPTGYLSFGSAINGGAWSDGQMVLTSAGNVGIGTTSPNVKLDVLSGTANTAGDYVTASTLTVTGPNIPFGLISSNSGVLNVDTNDALGADIGGSIALGGRFTGTQQAQWALIKGAKENATDGNYASYLAFGTRANGAVITEKMRIDSSGNVGIGTASPLSRLHVKTSGTALSSTASDSAQDELIEGANLATPANGNLSVVSNSAVAADAGGYLTLGGKYSGNSWANFGGIKAGKDNATAGEYGGYLSFYSRTNGVPPAERMRITSEGLVGIGTTNPGYKLDISGGSLKVSNSGTTTGIIINADATQETQLAFIKSGVNKWTQYIPASSNDLRFYDYIGGGDYVTFKSGGNVGIGTTTPTYHVHIKDAVNGSQLAVESNQNNASIDFVNTQAGGRSFTLSSTGGSSSVPSSFYLYDNTAGAYRLMLNSSGNVGIGTTSPSSLLHLYNGAAQISGAGSTYASRSDTLIFTRNDLPTSYKNKITNSHAGVSADQTMNFELNDSDGGANNLRTVMTLVGNGRAGIGTTAPVASLDVAAANTSTGGIGNVIVRSTDAVAADKGGAISFGGYYTGTSIADYAGISGRKENATDGNYAGYLAFITRTNGSASAERMRIDSAGNVGLGTTSPASKLDILPTATFAAAGVSGITQRAHTVTLSGADPTTYATFYGSQIGALTLVGTNTNQTVTTAAGLVVAPAIKSTNVALTNTHGILIPTTAVSTATNGYGLTVNAPTGATNNYAAVFSGGNVGIGTVTPASKLSISTSGGTDALIIDQDNFAGRKFLKFDYSSSTGSYGSFGIEAGALNLAIGPAVSNFTITGGNVGIGTPTPSSKLDITTTALGTTQTATSGLALVNTTAAAAGAQQISPAVRWTGQGWKTNATAASEAVEFRSYVVPVQGTADPTGYLSFGSSINGGAWSDGQMVLTSAGNVGIGTTSPSAFLHVLGTTEQQRLGYDTSNYWKSTVGSTGLLTMQGVGTGGALTLSPTAGQNVNISLATTGDFAVNTNQLYVDTSAGNVGIGTTAPDKVLEVNLGAANAFRLTYNDSNGSAANYTDFNVNSSGNLNVVSSGGFVGIGTASPDAALDVTGAIQSSDLLGGATTLSTDVNGNIIRTPSDRNLKQNIAPLSSAESLQKVLDLQGVSYTFKDQNIAAGNQIGFIAQDVGQIVPEVVSAGGAYYSLNYGNMVALVVEAIKELDAQTLKTGKPWRLTDATGAADQKTYEISNHNGDFAVSRLNDAGDVKTDYLTIKQGGNVGIGTSNPGQLLTVDGTFGISGSGAGSGFHTIFQGGEQEYDINYTLPTFSGTGFLYNDGEGVLQWMDWDADAVRAGPRPALFAQEGEGAGLEPARTEPDGMDGMALAALAPPPPPANNLDFPDLADHLTLDASTDIAVGLGHELSVTNTGTGNSLIVNDEAADTTPFVIDHSGNVGVGTSTPQAKVDIVSTTEQQRIGYDSSNYYSTTVANDGMVTHNAVGSNAGFTFANAVTMNGGGTINSPNSAHSISVNNTTTTINGGATINSGNSTGNSVIVGDTQSGTVGSNTFDYGTRVNGGMFINGDLGVNGNIYSLTPQTSLLVNNETTGQSHGIVIQQEQTVLSGGTHSTTLTLDDTGATFANSSVGGPARVMGVADGQADTDAVNVRQLSQSSRRAYAGIAAASAIASIPPPAPGHDYSVGLGFGNFADQDAVAVGAKAVVGERKNITLSASFGYSDDNPTTGVGASYSW